MSITPVDKPPDGDDEATTARSHRPSSVRRYLERFVTRIRKHVANFGLPLEGPDDPPPGGPIQTREDDAGSPVGTDPRECSEFDDFPNREYPLSYPGRDISGINSPDVVSIETDEGLRISAPGNPDAELTSDVWTDVEA